MKNFKLIRIYLVVPLAFPKLPIKTELYIAFLAQIGQSSLSVFCKSIEYKKFNCQITDQIIL
jgi:hypothetical protein